VEQGLATVRLVCSGWKCRHDALLMRLVLRQDATNERACWCGAAVARWTSSATGLYGDPLQRGAQLQV
jgi:hypothetical protein